MDINNSLGGILRYPIVLESYGGHQINLYPMNIKEANISQNFIKTMLKDKDKIKS